MATTYNSYFRPTSGGGGGSWGQTGGWTFLDAIQAGGDGGSALHDASFAEYCNQIYFSLNSTPYSGTTIPTYSTINFVYVYGSYSYNQSYNPGGLVTSTSSGSSGNLNGPTSGSSYAFYIYPSRSDLASFYAQFYCSGNGTSTPVFSIDYINVQVNWQYIQLSPTSSAATNILTNAARLNGSCSNGGDANAQRYFEWGTSSGSYGTGNSGWAAVNGSTYHDATGLLPGVTYYYRMRAKNSGSEEFYSTEQSFTTLPAGLILFF